MNIKNEFNENSNIYEKRRKRFMKEFKVVKCLENGKVNEFVVFADGSRKKIIQVDEQYGKYFEVENELNAKCKTFSGRIKDAVDTIKAGNGDCIKSMQTFGRHDKVVYFLDRTIGEKLRQKFLNGWSDAKFGWAIECGNKNSFSGYSMLNSKMEKISAFNEDDKPMVFNTEEAAKQYAEGMIERARYYTKRMVNGLASVTEATEKEKIVDKTIDEINEYAGTKFSVLLDFVDDMLTDDCKLKPSGCSLDNMGYKIVQCII